MKGFLLHSISIVLLSSCAAQKTSEHLNGDLLKTEADKMVIGYNENLETLALIYNLSEAGDFLFSKNPTPRAALARTLTARFEAYRQHQAVIKLNNLLNADLVDLYDIGLSVYNTPLPDYIQYVDYASIYYEHDSLTPAEIRSLFEDFHAAVRDFYFDAQLRDFFDKEGKELYSKLMQEVASVAPNAHYVKVMEEFSGIPRNSYSILVSAFAFNGIGRSQTIQTNNGTDIYQIVSSDPETESDNITLDNLHDAQLGYTNKDYFREISTHELGHSFYHESLREDQEIIAQLNQLSYLYTDKLKSDMRRQGYQDWITCFDEHLVRAGELIIAEKLGEKAFFERYYEECLTKRGFIYLDDVLEALRTYDANRSIYPDLTSVLPELIGSIRDKHPNQD